MIHTAWKTNQINNQNYASNSLVIQNSFFIWQPLPKCVKNLKPWIPAALYAAAKKIKNLFKPVRIKRVALHLNWAWMWRKNTGNQLQNLQKIEQLPEDSPEKSPEQTLPYYFQSYNYFWEIDGAYKKEHCIIYGTIVYVTGSSLCQNRVKSINNIVIFY